MNRRKLLKGIASAALLPFIPKVVKEIAPIENTLPNFAMMLPKTLEHDTKGYGVGSGRGEFTVVRFNLNIEYNDDGSVKWISRIGNGEIMKVYDL